MLQLCMNKMPRQRVDNGLALELSMCMEDVLPVVQAQLANPLWGLKCIGAVATIKEGTVDLTIVAALLQLRTLPRAYGGVREKGTFPGSRLPHGQGTSS